MAHNQIRAVAYGVREAQEKANIPAGRILTPTNTCLTRWGNTYMQVHKTKPLPSPSSPC